jgi:glycosyltransferase involved in cell wall biosynthesis
MFAQAWLYKCVVFPNAELVCFVKKNTYLESNAPWKRLRVWLENLCVARVHHFIAGSVMAANMLRRRFGLDIAKVSVGHHLGVDTDVFSPTSVQSERASNSEQEPLVVGYCGRFDDDKGVLELVESVRQVRVRTGKSIVLALLGRGSLSSVLEIWSSTESWIQIHQPVLNANVVHFLRRLDIFVFLSKALPDHEEHDAHALLEALACGLPCIATDVGINAEILRQDNGILVPRASPEALFDAIVHLVGDAAERGRLGRRARAVAIHEYSLDVVAQRKASILERVARE